MNAAAPRENLLFAWEPGRARALAIFGFVALSAAAHGVCFYLFQIVYPPTVALLPPPARVNLISEHSDEGRAVLQWIAAEDPALATTTQRSPEAKTFILPKLNHVPSYLTAQPALKHLPLLNPGLQVPSSQPPGPVPIPRAQNPPPSVRASTTILFASDADSLGEAQQPPMKFSASTREPPQSASFRIAVNNDGIVRYCFLQNSSGDAALNKQARSYLMLCRFPSANKTSSRGGDQLKWTTATFEWGNDVIAPPAPAGETLP